MDQNKIGLFIKELRKEKKMSQQQLADKIPIDRTGLSRWENGDVLPPVDKMKLLCEIFDISVDELLSGERSTIINKADHQKNLFDFLINQDSKYKKVKKFAIWASIVLLLITITFFIYYFYQTYNTEKVYKIYTESDEYVIKNGILVTTRETSYFKIGAINDNIYDIEIYYKDNNKKVIMFKGSSDSLLVDLYHNGTLINGKTVSNISDNLYMKIDDREIKIYIKQYYKNSNLILKNTNYEYDTNNQKASSDNVEIPIKIVKNFKCDNEICIKTENDLQIYYNIEDNIIYLTEDNIYVQYDLTNDVFNFNNSTMNFSIENGNLNCSTGNCSEYDKMYEKYYVNLIKKYL